MKFTTVSHACMYVETPQGSILIDPWVLGSCYWRSWWNYPEPSPELIARLKPDFIYITHLHWDHFHAPSLKLFDKNTTFLLPKAPPVRMVKDLKSLGYHNIIEIPHGDFYEPWEGFRLYVYQFGPLFIDSAVVLTDGKTTLLNANDSKVFGWPLKQIQDKFKQFDFVFRSHSSASPIPYCIEGYEDKYGAFRTKQDYIEEFTYFGLHLKAKYAVPFASNHCFLHKDTLHFNATSADPLSVEAFYNQESHALGMDSRCVVMPSGSSWSPEEGFYIEPFDYKNKEVYIASLLEKHKEKLEKHYEKEKKTLGDFKSFVRYFTPLLNALPFVIRHFFFPQTLFMIQDSSGIQYWLIDPKKKSVENKTAEVIQGNIEGLNWDIAITMNGLMVNDCSRKWMYSTWTPSKLFKVRLKAPSASLKHANHFFAILDYYENEGFPLWKNFTWRQISVRLRRFREFVEAFMFVVKYGVLKQKFEYKKVYPVERGSI